MKWTKEYIKERMEKDDRVLYRGLIAIYKRQTLEEQNIESTRVLNGRGFNKIDCKFLTSLAKDFLKYNNLTPKQKKYCRQKMLKYSQQLSKIANGEI